MALAHPARNRRQAITITYGDCAENHVGMQTLGSTAAEGLHYRDLVTAKWRFEAAGCQCELIDIGAAGRVEDLDPEPAEILIVRGGVNALLARAGLDADAWLAEQEGLVPDRKALMRGRVVNKQARYNLCFADGAQEPAYEEGKGRVVDFASLPATGAIRDALPAFFGPKTAELQAEGNYYYDAAKCGIGFHGDTERRIVVACRLGVPIPLHYQWFLRSAPQGSRVELALGHGDLYAMSEKAVGFDWKRPSILTLRHAAGCRKYLAIAP